MKHSPLLLAFGLLVLGSLVPIGAQRVRLRSQITPVCSSSTNLKFADIYADGNIAVQGSYLCRGAFIYDISHPDKPVLASWYNPNANLQILEAIVIGDRGYFGTGNGGGVHIVDLSNPYDPVLIRVIDPTTGGGFDRIHEMIVFDQDGQRYLIENYNGFGSRILKVINVTDPSNPFLVRDLVPTEPVWIHAMHVRGDRLFTSGWGSSSVRGRTEIYDISSLATQPPALIGIIEDPNPNVTAGNNMHSSWTSEDGNYLYSARETGDGTGDIRVYDISDPGQPLLVNSITMQSLGLNAITPHNPVVMGNYLFISWYQAGIQVFDISNPASPKRVGQWDTFQAEFAPPAAAETPLLVSDPWDAVCGSERQQNILPDSFQGAWAVYPFLGRDKILAGDLSSGLLVLDTTEVTGPQKNKVADFDGDRRTDLSVFTPSTGTWQTESSSDNSITAFPWGVAGDVLAAGDYDGDGRTDLAVWRPSNATWYFKNSSGYFLTVSFGAAEDVPVPADYDADGRTDIAVWRPSNGTWYIKQSSLGYRVQQWGTAGDKVLAGDFEGDGKADLAVWRPANGVWYVLTSSSSSQILVGWGQNGDKPLLGDFDGDGKAEYTIFRPSTGFWYILNTAAGTITQYQFGIAGDIPIPADYDGDGNADAAVFRPDNNVWYRLNSSNGGFVARPFGQRGDQPAPISVQPR